MKQSFRAKYPVVDLEPHPQNPNRGDVDAISKSIEATGFFGAVLVQQSRSRIIAGEHRWRAAQQAGEKHVPVLLIDCTDDQARTIMLADNRYPELSERDPAALIAIVDDMGTIAGTGYSDDDIDAYRRMIDDDIGWGDAIDGLPEGDRDPFQQMTFTFHDEQAEQVRAAMAVAFGLGEFDSPNPNRNGNALARVCELFLHDRAGG